MMIIGIGRIGALAVRQLVPEFPQCQMAICDPTADAPNEEPGIMLLDPDRILPQGSSANPAKVQRILCEYLISHFTAWPPRLTILLCHEINSEESYIAATLRNYLLQFDSERTLRIGPEDGNYGHQESALPFRRPSGFGSRPPPYISVGINAGSRSIPEADIHRFADLYADVARTVLQLVQLYRGASSAEADIRSERLLLKLAGQGIVINSRGNDEARSAVILRDGLRQRDIRYYLAKSTAVFFLAESSRAIDNSVMTRTCEELSDLIPEGVQPDLHLLLRQDDLPLVRMAVLAFRNPQALTETRGRLILPSHSGGGPGGEPASTHPTPADTRDPNEKPGPGKPDGWKVN